MWSIHELQNYNKKFVSKSQISNHNMSWFKNIFKKEEKESLDKGLEKSSTGFFDKISRAVVGLSLIHI